MSTLKLFYRLPPEKILQKMKRKVFGSEKGIFSLDDVLGSKYMQGQRMTNFLWRYQTIIQRTSPLWRLHFSGKRVLEVGGGPVLGWAPFAIFMGCTRYVLIEPMYNASIREHPETKRLLMHLHKDLCALYGDRMSFNAFLRALEANVVVYKKYLEDFTDEEGFEIVLSNSTLEHVADLDRALRQLRQATITHCTFLHSVDFGNHRRKTDPFAGMYDRTPEEYFRRFGKNINLLRGSDILALFKKNGFAAMLVPYYSMDYSGFVHAHWTQRYTKEDLLLKGGLFVNALQ